MNYSKKTFGEKLTVTDAIQDKTVKNNFWNEVNNKALNDYGYTGGYTETQESFSLQALILNNDTYSQIKSATEQIINIFQKTTKFVQNNIQNFGPYLGISKSLYDVVCQRLTDNIVFIGRMDWVIDTEGHLKLLEFNSETPAGIIESMVLNHLIHQRLYPNTQNPNVNMEKRISEVFTNIVEDYKKSKKIENIGVICTLNEEDSYNTKLVYQIINKSSYNFTYGTIDELKLIDRKLSLKQNPLDAVFRYYPLIWFDQEPELKGFIDAFINQTLNINPPAAYINQTKAFFALIWSLTEKGFFNKEENYIIKKYIPQTVKDLKKLAADKFCIKPYTDWGGKGIMFGSKLEPIPRNADNCVFQEKVEIQKIIADIWNSGEPETYSIFPVIGAFVIGNTFEGVYTRIGAEITDDWAVFLPTFIE